MLDYDIIVIGAGIGGLTAAALLARAGYHVLALEGHIEPGGCASSFERKRPNGDRYVFDVGATLFAGFEPGGAHHWVGRRLGITWPVRPLEPAMPPETLGDLARLATSIRPEMALLLAQLPRTVGRVLDARGLADRRLRAY